MNSKDEYLQRKIDFEIKMRDGTAKLLAASKHPHQMLEAAKNLLASNMRMIAYMSELQKRKTDEVLKRRRSADGNQVPCKAKICISDLRIPLMWKDTDHFKNKGDHRRYAIFCLWKIGTEIYDTTLIRDVDRSSTDVTFDDVVVFNDVGSDFECHLEVYCHKLYDDMTIASTSRKIKRKIHELSHSVGRSVGKRLSGLKDDMAFTANMLVGPKYELIAQATLRLADISDSVMTYELAMEEANNFHNADGSNNGDLPLYGHFCCRLAAQPLCLLQDAATGLLQVKTEGIRWQKYWCTLKRLRLSCWDKESDISAGVPACLEIPITKDTEVSRVAPSGDGKSSRQHCFHVSHRTGRKKRDYRLATSSVEELNKWWEALQQHMLDQALWQHVCTSDMTIKHPSPRKLPNFMKTEPTRSTLARSSLFECTDWKEVEESPMSLMLARLNVEEETKPTAPSTSTSKPTRLSTKMETNV